MPNSHPNPDRKPVICATRPVEPRRQEPGERLPGDERDGGHERAIEQQTADHVAWFPAHDERTDDAEHRECDDEGKLLTEGPLVHGHEPQPHDRDHQEGREHDPGPARVPRRRRAAPGRGCSRRHRLLCVHLDREPAPQSRALRRAPTRRRASRRGHPCGRRCPAVRCRNPSTTDRILARRRQPRTSARRRRARASPPPRSPGRTSRRSAAPRAPRSRRRPRPPAATGRRRRPRP